MELARFRAEARWRINKVSHRNANSLDKYLSLKDEKTAFWVPTNIILRSKIMKNEVWVGFGVPEGSQMRPKPDC